MDAKKENLENISKKKSLKDKLKNNINQRFAKFRKNHPEITFQMVQEKTGLSEPAIQRSIFGKFLSVENLRAICLATGVSCDYLLGLTENEYAINLDTYKGVFFYIRYLLETGIIEESTIVDDDTNEKGNVFIVTGDPGSILKAYEKINQMFYEDMNMYYLSDYSNVFSDTLNSWKRIRKDLFKKYAPEKPLESDSLNAILSSHLKKQFDLKKQSEPKKWSQKSAELYKNYKELFNAGNIKHKFNGWEITLDDAYATLGAINDTNISKYFSGDSRPTLDKIVIFSQLFGVTTDYLLGLDGDVDVPPSPSTLFDALITMADKLIFGDIYILYDYIGKKDVHQIIVRDPIVERFCSQYIDIYTSLKKTDNLKSRQIFFQNIADNFDVKIPKEVPYYNITLGESHEHLEECLQWLNAHPNGQTYDEAKKENDDLLEHAHYQAYQDALKDFEDEDVLKNPDPDFPFR